MFGRNFPPFNSFGGYYRGKLCSLPPLLEVVETERNREPGCQKTGRHGIHQ